MNVKLGLKIINLHTSSILNITYKSPKNCNVNFRSLTLSVVEPVPTLRGLNPESRNCLLNVGHVNLETGIKNIVRANT
jgi:hypothetical protein